jgi:hypothetical protein
MEREMAKKKASKRKKAARRKPLTTVRRIKKNGFPGPKKARPENDKGSDWGGARVR